MSTSPGAQPIVETVTQWPQPVWRTWTNSEALILKLRSWPRETSCRPERWRNCCLSNFWKAVLSLSLSHSPPVTLLQSSWDRPTTHSCSGLTSLGMCASVSMTSVGVLLMQFFCRSCRANLFLDVKLGRIRDGGLRLNLQFVLRLWCIWILLLISHIKLPPLPRHLGIVYKVWNSIHVQYNCCSVYTFTIYRPEDKTMYVVLYRMIVVSTVHAFYAYIHTLKITLLVRWTLSIIFCSSLSACLILLRGPLLLCF